MPVTSIDEATQIAKNNELITRGNHASALAYSNILDASLDKEFKQGWMIPLPITFVNQLKHSEVAPIGVTKQWQAHEDGSQSAKY